MTAERFDKQRDCTTVSDMPVVNQSHFTHVLDDFRVLFRDKYIKGYNEHGGLLSDLKTDALLNAAVDETLDLVAYLLTLKQRAVLNNPESSETLLLDAMINEETDRAVKLHGTLTEDNFRAYAILGEEFGEIGCCILELRRHRQRIQVHGTGDAVDLKIRSDLLKELVQLVSVARLMANRLIGEGVR